MLLKDFSGLSCGREDDSGHLAKFQTHNRAIRLGKLGQGFVGFVAKQQEISNDGKRLWSRWKLFASCKREEFQGLKYDPNDEKQIK
ncbi:hypothetical protein L484_005457 [Morus notabilis]|uniref:Uncharacterized protein n=1 Tax=Morus notabilis TaxID=981085 RepID=W9RS82_9ROSA|nr:hypothetical protein L484_005457 [Morus notabilis]